MAFACAYAVLGDAYLAEDVAQDAFVVAWQKLDQLREANAFPGWFKRIVLNQCNRLTRGSRLQIVPLDVPAVGQNLWQPSAAPPKESPLPSVDEILDRYVQALGGAQAFQKVVSRV